MWSSWRTSLSVFVGGVVGGQLTTDYNWRVSWADGARAAGQSSLAVREILSVSAASLTWLSLISGTPLQVLIGLNRIQYTGLN